MHLQTILKEKQFISYCLEDIKIVKTCYLLGVKLNNKLLKQNKILPDSKGYYSITQRSLLYNTLSNNGKIFSEKEESYTQAKEIYKFIGNLTSIEDSSEVKLFLLTTLSDEFNKEIISLRKNNNIPEEGFEDEESFAKWVGYQENTYPSPLSTALVSYTNEIIDNKKIAKIFSTIESIVSKYKLNVLDSTVSIYFFHGFNGLIFLTENLKRQIKKPVLSVVTPSQYFDFENKKWSKSDINLKPIHHTKGFYIHIQVQRPELKKKDLDSFFQKYLNNIKKELKDFNIEHISSSFKENWLIYFLYKRLKMNITNINVFLSKYTNIGKINKEKFKKIKQRMKMDIEQLKGDN